MQLDNNIACKACPLQQRFVMQQLTETECMAEQPETLQIQWCRAPLKQQIC
jgi:hypothetical protein